METLRKFFRLEPAERQVLVAAAALVPLARLAARILPFVILRRLVAVLARSARSRGRPRLSAQRIAWAVRAAGPRMPGGGNCLAQALVLHVLLRRVGHPSTIRLSVARGTNGRLTAHAWVESAGAPLLPRLTGFTPLPPVSAD